ncbi:MAG TPA: aldo/keto reductase [Kofleriaceae bacterium]|jgi:diketogulonate reductase-like aldo/keto reductase
MHRRTFLAGTAAGLAGAALAGGRADARKPAPLLQRPIPSSGEKIPALGLGTWQTFDVSGARIAAVQPVLDRFLALGGRLVDSSPMYGNAEAAVGAMLKARGAGAVRPFLATKVWTSGAKEGVAQMRRSADRFGVKTIDLMQVHNLMDWKTHLPRMRAWKQAGTFRYIGVTHYQHGAFAELEQIIRKEKIDSVQLPCSVVDREAEKRLLPAAADAGVAVLILSPFESGALFRRVKGTALPAWAADIDCTSWAQVFLKFLLGHPAVTCPLPATDKVKHVEDNLQALRGRLPDEKLRDRIARDLS